jgi:ferritin-like metal-binding protein YciE
MARTTNKKKMGSTKASGSTGSRKDSFGNLHELFILKLQSLYDVEQELTKVLPKLVKHSSNQELKTAFREHLKETEGHVRRLEKAFKILDVTRKKEKVEGIRGIAEDGSWVMKHVKDDAARDAAIIAAAQYAEHYEIAGYGTAAEWADLMGHDEVADLLKETLAEEEAANEKLSSLAEGGINEEANDMEERDTEKRGVLGTWM